MGGTAPPHSVSARIPLICRSSWTSAGASLEDNSFSKAAAGGPAPSCVLSTKAPRWRFPRDSLASCDSLAESDAVAATPKLLPRKVINSTWPFGLVATASSGHSTWRSAPFARAGRARGHLCSRRAEASRGRAGEDRGRPAGRGRAGEGVGAGGTEAEVRHKKRWVGATGASYHLAAALAGGSCLGGRGGGAGGSTVHSLNEEPSSDAP